MFYFFLFEHEFHSSFLFIKNWSARPLVAWLVQEFENFFLLTCNYHVIAHIIIINYYMKNSWFIRDNSCLKINSLILDLYFIRVIRAIRVRLYITSHFAIEMIAAARLSLRLPKSTSPLPSALMRAASMPLSMSQRSTALARRSDRRWLKAFWPSVEA